MGAAEDALIGPEDDNFHPPSDDPWETETCWFAFCVPERSMMGYLYTWIRPNLGIAGGGALVWDDTAFVPWEVPFFDYNRSLPLPEGLDLRDCLLPTGMRVKAIEPLTSYELGYRYPFGDLFEAELRFDGLTPPHVFTRGEPPFSIASHIDQPGRVTGHIRLHGEHIDVDCYAMRDRSWGPRPDLRGFRIGYSFGTASDRSAFLCYSLPTDARVPQPSPTDSASSPTGKSPGDDPISAGYYLRDEVRADITGGRRRVERHPDHGYAIRFEIEAVDELGRELHAVGTPVSRIVFDPYPKMLSWISTTAWDFDGATGWGEDQDCWRPDQWSRFRRTPR
ncbi:DUF7065 domain-containing protein [Candidatus Poriferisocius sp.]|uniref:DUF7065 domain-containing protein n=1 Tax=Candidatus Poriferisocius sp. TaxID=3101276 RepID=UPI003B591F3E